MSFPRHSSYKDTNSKWLKEIPQHWNELRLKNVSERNVVGIAEAATHAYSDDGIPILRATNIREGKIIGKILKIDPKFAFAKERESKIIREGDLVSVRTGNAGKTVLIGNEIGRCHCFTMLITTPSQLASGKFLEYVINSKASQEYFAVEGWGTAQLNISVPIIQNLPIAIPSLDEQTDIANFLNHETTKIDALIAEQERLIELLQEKRQAVISHAVTKGLNPDAPMKESGVEWLGEVPEHWEIIPLNYVLQAVGDVDHYMPESTDSGIPYIMTGDLKDFTRNIDFNECKQVSEEDYRKLSKKIRTQQGDLILARYATIGTVSYVDIDKRFLVSYSCVTIKVNSKKIAALYLYFFIKSQAFASGIKSKVNSNTQDNVGIGGLKKVLIALPKMNEQLETVEYLQSASLQLNKQIKASQDAVRLLKERRSALISAAVTGQIDVRGLAPEEEAA